MRRFAEQGVEDLYNGKDTKAARRAVSGKAAAAARQKLDLLVNASALRDLAATPKNRLELHREGGRYQGYHSIRINDQYRILFLWTDAGAMNITIDDYHGR